VIRNRLRVLRGQHGRGISKAHLARQVGVSRSYITKLEKGTVCPSATLMFRLSTYFGCRVDDIFEYTPDPSEGQ
jgi:putative transcriptional regulator